jgi:hypothetical protein
MKKVTTTVYKFSELSEKSQYAAYTCFFDSLAEDPRIQNYVDAMKDDGIAVHSISLTGKGWMLADVAPGFTPKTVIDAILQTHMPEMETSAIAWKYKQLMEAKGTSAALIHHYGQEFFKDLLQFYVNDFIETYPEYTSPMEAKKYLAENDDKYDYLVNGARYFPDPDPIDAEGILQVLNQFEAQEPKFMESTYYIRSKTMSDAI